MPSCHGKTMAATVQRRNDDASLRSYGHPRPHPRRAHGCAVAGAVPRGGPQRRRLRGEGRRLGEAPPLLRHRQARRRHLRRHRPHLRAGHGEGAGPSAQPDRVRPAHQGPAPRGALEAPQRAAHALSPPDPNYSNPEPSMAGETQITLVGTLGVDPETRFTPSGAAVANSRVASTPRPTDPQSGEWRDGESMFLSCSVWRQYAENVAESLQRGMRVIVQGRLKQRSYETKEGERRTVFEIEVEEVGPALRHATAKVTKTQRQGGGYGGGYGGPPSGGGYGGNQGAPSGPPVDDPWATGGGGFGGGGG